LSKFSEYIIPLRNLEAGTHQFEYKLTNDFFAKIDSPEVQKGKVTVVLNVKKLGESFELNFDINGVVQVSCDRCLDDMDQPVSTKEKIFVKFGKEFAEENDDIVIVPEDEGEINIAWFMFEFIALTIPMKHVHPFGKCNKEMTSKLKKVSIYEKDADDADFDQIGPEDNIEEIDNTDPRWDELKKIINNN
jgi:uncharacterized metal-binding protein YceD (DUF177 family)